ncbi:hypothetical protein, variant [Exophiala mesophila]|uniref:Zn(2)-C6 fungal-type domain-containing protein n=1 Tax=Exophiala mesophila TaxID=212818 RepID=A0A0D1WUZ1_EXOME|nr:uncharacterized protein PV10_04355 [Exophiala mesophila]XP_016224690.1 hypothetical protein, variant [Exophiala mesophila]KIV93115.1 hypothetical protein PV10_04355 [Exophiala mesophila]KIV93116.1 hypothetical protein, variant [Exophiala mesophila]
MPSRISGACNGCRTKKQKCSGDRSGCLQCQAAGIQCTWPEQRKRGPAKGYIEGLEHRLHEAESLLLALLPLVTAAQLDNATESLNLTDAAGVGQASRDSTSPSPRNVRSSPPVLNKKTGIDYWESFPLDTVENIRRWQQDCAIHSQPPSTDRHASARDSLDNVSHARLLNSNPTSRQSSMDLKREALDGIFSASLQHNNRNNENFRSLSSDPYRSGTNTPINVTSAARHSPIPGQQYDQHPQQRLSSQLQSWQNSSLYASGSNPDATRGDASSNITLNAEALLLQSLAENNNHWAQPDQVGNNNMLMNMGMAMSMAMSSPPNHAIESAPMEIDTGFFNSDVQRRLFW